jgi:hypothetical protein
MNTIHNARITLGVGAIVAGIVAPMVNGRAPAREIRPAAGRDEPLRRVRED